MDTRLLYTGIALVAVAAVGIVIAIVMELITQEPVYFLIMKIAAGLSLISGPLIGIGIAKRKGKRGG
ncbi:unnamed protein product [marine sediment metagenome]|uniref:Uncharacterized protein n=1 Tax=marine sediment metagenome TaxID=412755 RepID=X1VUK0_9ZZZZ